VAGGVADLLLQAGRGLANLAGLGSKIVLGTHDLFEQIRCALGWLFVQAGWWLLRQLARAPRCTCLSWTGGDVGT